VGVAGRILDAHEQAGRTPSRSAKGCTKPMEPPAPIIAVSLLKPALSARRAGLEGGPSGSVVHHGVRR
jgi:hypothetical protein